jgi:hypothetical protein
MQGYQSFLSLVPNPNASHAVMFVACVSSQSKPTPVACHEEMGISGMYKENRCKAAMLECNKGMWNQARRAKVCSSEHATELGAVGVAHVEAGEL